MPDQALGLDLRQAIGVVKAGAARHDIAHSGRSPVAEPHRAAGSVVRPPKPVALRPRKHCRTDQAPDQESQQPGPRALQRRGRRHRCGHRRYENTPAQERPGAAAAVGCRRVTGMGKLRISPSIHQEWGSGGWACARERPGIIGGGKRGIWILRARTAAGLEGTGLGRHSGVATSCVLLHQDARLFTADLTRCRCILRLVHLRDVSTRPAAAADAREPRR